MALVHGPLLSVAASGTLGGIITASSWKGRQQLRKARSAASFPSSLQRANHVALAILRTQWGAIDNYGGGGNQAAWTAAAAGSGKSPYHYYLSYNMQRWQAGQFPIIRPGFSDFGFHSIGAINGTGTHRALSLRQSGLANNNPPGQEWIFAFYIAPTGTLMYTFDQLAFATRAAITAEPQRQAIILKVRPGVYDVGASGIRCEGTKDASSFRAAITVT